MISRWQFEMGLRTLLSLDMQELVDAGAIVDRDYAAWDAFKADPVRWMLTADDPTAHAVWTAIWRHRPLAGSVPPKPEPAPAEIINIAETRKKQKRRR